MVRLNLRDDQWERIRQIVDGAATTTSSHGIWKLE